MKIEILTRNVKNEHMVREFIDRKVNFALERLGVRVRSVMVRLEDETKDSGAFDGICRIEVELEPRGHLHVSSQGESASDCILQATRKMENAVKHEIERGRQSAQTRHQQNKRSFMQSLENSPENDDSVASDAP